MILNMHIRNDYRAWGMEDRKKQRVTTLCGKITAPKYAGIPGVTDGQEPFVSDDHKDFAWCLDCCQIFVRKTDNYVLITNHSLFSLYHFARLICLDQLKLAVTSPK